jgi:hypothetical protein
MKGVTLKNELRNAYSRSLQELNVLKARSAEMQSKCDAITSNGAKVRANLAAISAEMDRAKMGNISGNVSDDELAATVARFRDARIAMEVHISDEEIIPQIDFLTAELSEAYREFYSKRRIYFRSLKEELVPRGDFRKQIINAFIVMNCLNMRDENSMIFSGHKSGYEFAWNMSVMENFPVPSATELMNHLNEFLKNYGAQSA